jgi:hypothetical protein
MSKKIIPDFEVFPVPTAEAFSELLLNANEFTAQFAGEW